MIKIKGMLQMGILSTLIATLTSGCIFSGNPGISIINLPDGNKKFLSIYKYGQVIININKKTKYFQTLRRNERKLILRSISFDGKIINKKMIPLFSRFYVSTWEYSFSPDGNKLVYYKDKNLYLYDIQQNTEKILIKNISELGGSIVNVLYISSNDIMLLLKKDKAIGRTDCRIFKFDTSSMQIVWKKSATYLKSFKYAYSTSNSLLAFWDGKEEYSLYGNIKILDLKTGKIIRVIKGGNKTFISRMCFSSDEKILAFVEDETLKIYDIENRDIKIIGKFSKDKICFSLEFVNNNQLLYRIGTSSSAIKAVINIIDIKTKKIVKVLKNVKVNGSIFVVDNGKKIICEVGY